MRFSNQEMTRMKNKHNVKRWALAGLLAAASLSASAQQKPGLWEITSKMSGGGADAEKMAKAQADYQKQMAAMPPERRKMMEDMMAQHGMSMGAGGPGGGMTIKVCLTEDMVKRGQMSTGQAAQHGCTTTMSPRMGNTMKMSFVCTQPPSSGEGQFTFNGPESYTMQMTTHSNRGGTEHQMNMEASGRWLSSDCGSVKPITLPKQ
jgi:hypothetical protein